MGRPPRFEVTQVRDEHAPALAEFFRQVWDPAATAESVRSAWSRMATENVADPGLVPPTFVVLLEDRIIGYVSSLPVRVQTTESELPAYWVKGLMVLPEFRNGPVGFAVLKALVQRLPRSLVLTVAPASRRLFNAMGYRDLGAVPNYLRLLRAGRVLGRLDLERLDPGGVPRWARRLITVLQRLGVAGIAGSMGGACLALVALARTRSRGGITTRVLPEPPSEPTLDALWRQVSARWPAAIVRNGAYLRARYGGTDARGVLYHWVSAWRGEVLVALAVLRRPGEGDPRLVGIRLAALADLVVAPDDPDAALAVLRVAEVEAGHQDADGLLATVSHPGPAGWLRRRGYVAIGGNVHFFFRNVTGDLPEWSTDPERWWITRGDGESDGAL